MPEWAIYVLVAIMWVIGTGLVIVFVLIMYFIFGKQLKKLGFRVSVKDGIGVDVETHQPIEAIAKHAAISQQNPPMSVKSDIQILPAIQKERTAIDQINHQPNDNQTLDIRDRIKQLISLFNEERLSGALFGINNGDIEFDTFEKISILPKSLKTQFDIHAIIPSIQISAACLWEYSELFVICVQEMPPNRNKWASDLRSRANILGEYSLIWIVVLNDFPEVIREMLTTMADGFEQPKILTSSLIDIETLEIKLGKHQIR